MEIKNTKSFLEFCKDVGINDVISKKPTYKFKKDAFDNWFDKKVIVMGMGKGTRNKKIHNIIKKKVKEQLIKHCEAVERSYFHQSQFTANCLKEVARCKAKIACLENPVKQPTFKNFLRKLFDL